MTGMPQSGDLKGRVALVTGAASGIGRASAETLAARGAVVAVTDKDGEGAERVANAIVQAGGRAGGYALDVVDEAAVAAVFGKVTEDLGPVEILVNNVGIGARMPMTEMPLARWEQVLRVGLTGSFLCAREAGRTMTARRKGAVVQVSSIMGLVGGGLFPNLAYHTAKGGIVSMTRALAIEWAPYGVRVNAVAPTFVDTPLVQPVLTDAKLHAGILEATPFHRLASAQEIADAIVFLASDAAAMITGVTLPVDGGWTAK